MKVAILIMCTDNEPSLSNINGMLNSFITDYNGNVSNYNNSYEFFFYDCVEGSDEQIHKMELHDNCYKLSYNSYESVYKTYEKTIFAFKAISEFDWYVRINISTFINMRLLDIIIKQLDRNIIYCNAINTIVDDYNYQNNVYPRGDFFIISNSIKNGIIEKGEKYINCDQDRVNRINVPHVDDCLIGLCIIDLLGKFYFNQIKSLVYNYLPDNDIKTIDDLRKRVITSSNDGTLFNIALASRVKTLPPGVNYSGYSWDDNIYRRCDSDKMIILSEYYKSVDYNKNKSIYNINNICILPSKSRETIFLNPHSVRLDFIYHALTQMSK